ncbi:MAG: branched-chain amino acid transaminase [Candidatus Diapherotrites archaeon]|nr:branched-chain amino acid transaminase [Candidatus Diapherotrites archaeon]
MGVKLGKKVWLSGKLISSSAARIGFANATLQYGFGAFEGIRAYETATGKTALFRLREHCRRLKASWNALGMKLPYSLAEIERAVKATVKANRLNEGYIRPLLFLEGLSFNPLQGTPQLMIGCWDWNDFFGGHKGAGLHMTLLPFRRMLGGQRMHNTKISGSYYVSLMARGMAARQGFQDALFSDSKGNVAEGTGDNVFLVKNKALITPPAKEILAGITRESVMEIAKKTGYRVQEKCIRPKDLLHADEAFVTGTAAEIEPIIRVDGHWIGNGKEGPITRALRGRFALIVRGKEPAYRHWLTFLK